jgi:hypothetical protein
MGAAGIEEEEEEDVGSGRGTENVDGLPGPSDIDYRLDIELFEN